MNIAKPEPTKGLLVTIWIATFASLALMAMAFVGPEIGPTRLMAAAFIGLTYGYGMFWKTNWPGFVCGCLFVGEMAWPEAFLSPNAVVVMGIGVLTATMPIRAEYKRRIVNNAAIDIEA